MPRFCMAGCGTLLKLKDGSTDYESKFCSKECRNRDKAERIKEQRRKFHANENCPSCGQRMPERQEKKKIAHA